MSALLALTHTVAAAAPAAVDFVLAAGSTGIVNKIRDFVGPIFLLVCGIAAMSFLFQRQMTQFAQFIGLMIAIALIFYFPGVIESLAKFFSTAF